MSLPDASLRAIFASNDPGALERAGARFGHREHLRVAWLYLGDGPLLGAIGRFCADLRRFATAAGAPGKYHETLSVAFMLLVHERMGETTRAPDSGAFVDANPDLLAWPGGPLTAFYAPETLEGAAARTRFVLPDQTAWA